MNYCLLLSDQPPSSFWWLKSPMLSAKGLAVAWLVLLLRLMLLR